MSNKSNLKKFLSRLIGFLDYKISLLARWLVPIYKSIISVGFFKVLNLIFYKKKLPTDNKYAVLRWKYYSSNSTEDSTEKIQLEDTLEKFTGQKICSIFYEDLHASPFSDLGLIRFCIQNKITHLIVSSWSEDMISSPSKNTFNFLRDKFGIKIYGIWWDSCFIGFSKILESIFKYMDMHIIIDNPNGLLLTDEQLYNDRIKRLWCPQNEKFFYPVLNKDINVSFQGQASAYRGYRKKTIDYLQDKNVAGYFSLANRSIQNSHVDYAKITRQSKCVINFSYSVDCEQLKSRVFEAFFSGSLLFESSNRQIEAYFEPYVDFIPFSSEVDLLEKINYYITRPDKLKKISSNANLKSLKNYSSDKFWEAVFS